MTCFQRSAPNASLGSTRERLPGKPSDFTRSRANWEWNHNPDCSPWSFDAKTPACCGPSSIAVTVDVDWVCCRNLTPDQKQPRWPEKLARTEMTLNRLHSICVQEGEQFKKRGLCATQNKAHEGQLHPRL